MIVGKKPSGIPAGTSADDDDVVQGFLRVRPLRLVQHRVWLPGYAGPVKTRYLLIISLATALVILGASAVWFLMAVT